MIATVGAVIAAPILILFGWYGWEFTKERWPENWPGWAGYAGFSLAMVLGPVVGWGLLKRGRPKWALFAGVLGFALVPLIVLGWVLG